MDRDPIYSDETAARKHLEAIRWPFGATCPWCKSSGNVSALAATASTGEGWYHCGRCRRKFTVRVGTLFQRSHIPLHKWIRATRLLCCSKNRPNVRQLQQTLGVTYKSAWHMAKKIQSAKELSLFGPFAESVHGQEASANGELAQLRQEMVQTKNRLRALEEKWAAIGRLKGET